jgi:hypothetical protein
VTNFKFFVTAYCKFKFLELQTAPKHQEPPMPAHCSPEHLADYYRDLHKHEPRRSDLLRDRKRLAVAALVGECESLVGSGVLTEPAERSLRFLIAETLSAHGMPSIAEREGV